MNPTAVMKLKNLFLLFAALSVALLSACGGSDDDDGPGSVRLINATTEYASLDFYASDTRVAAAVLQDSVSDYVSLSSGSITFKLKQADSATTSLATARTVSSGVSSTLVAYTTGGTLRTAYMNDTESAPTSGTAKLRAFNGSIEAGSLDVYLTSVGGTLDQVSALINSLGSTYLSTYGEIGSGSYRLVVTGAGDKTDIRLDIPSISFANQQVATLILTNTPGGVLVHGLLLNQGSTLSLQKNTSARIRLVAGSTANGTVAAAVNGSTLASGLRSPSVGGYTLVPAGALSTDIQVNGVTVATSGLTATAGADLSLLVLGTPDAPQVALLSDNNYPPTTSTNAKLRLVNGVNGLNGSITLTADYGAVASNVAFANASAAASVLAGTDYRLEASSPVSTSVLYLATEVTLQATRVYTVFMLGDTSAPVGVLWRDR